MFSEFTFFNLKFLFFSYKLVSSLNIKETLIISITKSILYSLFLFSLVIHRIDRLTSGLVIIGKDKVVANRIAKQIESHQVSKYYICKVNGQFPKYVKDNIDNIKILTNNTFIFCFLSFKDSIDNNKILTNNTFIFCFLFSKQL
jgi:hypothetical protein